jgi:hypothetical protein
MILTDDSSSSPSNSNYSNKNEITSLRIQLAECKDTIRSLKHQELILKSKNDLETNQEIARLKGAYEKLEKETVWLRWKYKEIQQQPHSQQTKSSHETGTSDSSSQIIKQLTTQLTQEKEYSKVLRERLKIRETPEASRSSTPRSSGSSDQQIPIKTTISKPWLDQLLVSSDPKTISRITDDCLKIDFDATLEIFEDSAVRLCQSSSYSPENLLEVLGILKKHTTESGRFQRFLSEKLLVKSKHLNSLQEFADCFDLLGQDLLRSPATAIDLARKIVTKINTSKESEIEVLISQLHLCLAVRFRGFLSFEEEFNLLRSVKISSQYHSLLLMGIVPFLGREKSLEKTGVLRAVINDALTFRTQYPDLCDKIIADCLENF